MTEAGETETEIEKEMMQRDSVSLPHLNRDRHQNPGFNMEGRDSQNAFNFSWGNHVALRLVTHRELSPGSDRVQSTARLLAQFIGRALHSHGFNPFICQASARDTAREHAHKAPPTQPPGDSTGDSNSKEKIKRHINQQNIGAHQILCTGRPEGHILSSEKCSDGWKGISCPCGSVTLKSIHCKIMKHKQLETNKAMSCTDHFFYICLNWHYLCVYSMALFMTLEKYE